MCIFNFVYGSSLPRNFHVMQFVLRMTNSVVTDTSIRAKRRLLTENARIVFQREQIFYCFAKLTHSTHQIIYDQHNAFSIQHKDLPVRMFRNGLLRIVLPYETFFAKEPSFSIPPMTLFLIPNHWLESTVKRIIGSNPSHITLDSCSPSKTLFSDLDLNTLEAMINRHMNETYIPKQIIPSVEHEIQQLINYSLQEITGITRGVLEDDFTKRPVYPPTYIKRHLNAKRSKNFITQRGKNGVSSGLIMSSWSKNLIANIIFSSQASLSTES